MAEAIRPHTGADLGDAIRFFIGMSGALILLASVTTSISGFCRLAYSLGEHGQLPRSFGRLNRRTLVSPQAIVSVVVVSSAVVIASAFVKHDVSLLAGIFSFGVLLAFTATQIAVIKLRIAEPDLPRPYRTPLNVTIRKAEIPLPGDRRRRPHLRDLDHRALDPRRRALRRSRLARDRAVVYAAVRRSRGEGLTERVVAPDTVIFTDVPHFRRILVPMKLGVIGEEMAATAVKLAAEHHAAVEALYVVLVPLDCKIDAADAGRRGAGRGVARRRRCALGQELGVEVEATTVRARAIGRAIVDHARDSGADLIVLGLLAPLAPPVALLLADRRLRAAAGAVRGADRRVPAERARRRARSRAQPAPPAELRWRA